MSITTSQARRRALVLSLLPALLLGVAGCQRTKSSNPLSPLVAGPQEGVTITAPKPVEPIAGKKIKDTEQPITLVLERAYSNSPRAFTMSVQLAADGGFNNVVFSRVGLTPSADCCLERVALPDRIQPGRMYYWRLKADDGANTSGWSAMAQFELLQPVVLGTPEPRRPIANERVSSNTPEFAVANGASSGPHGALIYNFQISENQTFANIFSNADVPQGDGGETRYTMPPLPGWDRMFYWRVRIWDGTTTGQWSRIETFRSPLAPAPVPPPPPPGTPVPTNNCESLVPNKDAVIQCYHALIQPRDEVQAFEVTKRVAWAFRNEQMGLLIKDGGENIVFWNGRWFSAARICYPDGHIYKIMSDVGPGGANSPTWHDDGFVDPSRYVPAMNPGG